MKVFHFNIKVNSKNRIRFLKSTLIIVVIFLSACSNTSPKEESKNENVQNSLYDHHLKQYYDLNELGHEQGGMPIYLQKDGTMKIGKEGDGAVYLNWILGFYPGALWYLSELTGDSTMQAEALHYSSFLRNYMKDKVIDHDIGFVVNCAFGNEYLNGLNLELNKKEIIYWSDQLMKRFDPRVGVFQSWDLGRSWIKEKAWQYPVIIDNMMNLELLFKATEFSGDSSYYHTALLHADKTMKHHFRKDYSSYHMVNYDSLTGEVLTQETVQGFADSSAWARGQSWGLYGYTMTYRFTKEAKYLEFAKNIASFLLNHPNLPEDKIPYWDYNADEIPNTYRDASSAAIMASALFELYQYDADKRYVEVANRILSSLNSEDYLSKPDQYFILQHSVGSIPHGSQIDNPLNYADYYYLEALLRQKSINIILN